MLGTQKEGRGRGAEHKGEREGERASGQNRIRRKERALKVSMTDDGDGAESLKTLSTTSTFVAFVLLPLRSCVRSLVPLALQPSFVALPTEKKINMESSE